MPAPARASSSPRLCQAFTPLLEEPLEGPVYFRSNGGVSDLPDVVADLGGQFRFKLVIAILSTDSGRVRTKVLNAPDAPVSKFVLRMAGGKKGLLENSQNLCRHRQRQSSTSAAKTAAASSRPRRSPPTAARPRRRARPRSGAELAAATHQAVLIWDVSAASSASAEPVTGHFLLDEAGTTTGAQVGANFRFAFSSGLTITCNTHFDGIGTQPSSSNTMTVTPTCNGCSAIVSIFTFPATCTHEDCDYTFYGTEGDASLSCSEGVLSFHIYQNSSAHAAGTRYAH